MVKEELEIIKHAIINEIESYEFYKMAIGNFDDPEIKEALKDLMEEEKNHVMWLEELFAKMKETDDDDVTLSNIPSPEPDKPFVWDVTKVKDIDSALSVYGIGLELEKRAADFYNEQKDKTTNEDAKRLFGLLAKWEKAHLDSFSKMYDVLRHEWWNRQNYAPF